MGAKAYPGGKVTGTLAKKAKVQKTMRQKAGASHVKNAASYKSNSIKKTK